MRMAGWAILWINRVNEATGKGMATAATQLEF
jgi:hypothetical protein